MTRAEAFAIGCPALDLRKLKPMTPEDCKLVACHTGDGWLLTVETADGHTIGILAWPEAWPEQMTTEALKLAGFEVV